MEIPQWQLINDKGDCVYPDRSNEIICTLHVKMDQRPNKPLVIAVDYDKIKQEIKALIPRANISLEELFECLEELDAGQYE